MPCARARVGFAFGNENGSCEPSRIRRSGLNGRPQVADSKADHGLVRLMRNSSGTAHKNKS